MPSSSDSDASARLDLPTPVTAAADPIDAGLRALLSELGRTIAGWELQARPLGPELERCSGKLGAEPVTLHLASARGAGWESFTLGALVDARGALRSVTACGLPERGRLRPIVGIDLVALGGRLSLIALDLSPLDDAFHAEHAAPLLRALRERASGLVLRKLPDFAVHSFSSLALIAGAPPGCEQAGLDAAIALARGIACLPALDPETRARTSAADARARSASARNEGCREAERRNRREAAALARMFGDLLAERILFEALFPTAPSRLTA